MSCRFINWSEIFGGKALFMDKQTWTWNSCCKLLQPIILDASSSRILTLTDHIYITFSKWGVPNEVRKIPRDSPSQRGLDASVLVHTQDRLLCSHTWNWTKLRGKHARIQSNCCLWSGCENAQEMSLFFKCLFICFRMMIKSCHSRLFERVEQELL